MPRGVGRAPNNYEFFQFVFCDEFDFNEMCAKCANIKLCEIEYHLRCGWFLLVETKRKKKKKISPIFASDNVHALSRDMTSPSPVIPHEESRYTLPTCAINPCPRHLFHLLSVAQPWARPIVLILLLRPKPNVKWQKNKAEKRHEITLPFFIARFE